MTLMSAVCVCVLFCAPHVPLCHSAKLTSNRPTHFQGEVRVVKARSTANPKRSLAFGRLRAMGVWGYVVARAAEAGHASAEVPYGTQGKVEHQATLVVAK
jgi:hypothetical protein